MLRFTRFSRVKLNFFWNLTGVKDLTNFMPGGGGHLRYQHQHQEQQKSFELIPIFNSQRHIN